MIDCDSVSVGDVFFIGKYVLLFESPELGTRRNKTKDIGFYICLNVANISSEIKDDTCTMLETPSGWVMRHHVFSLPQFVRSPLYFDLDGNFRQLIY